MSNGLQGNNDLSLHRKCIIGFKYNTNERIVEVKNKYHKKYHYNKANVIISSIEVKKMFNIVPEEVY